MKRTRTESATEKAAGEVPQEGVSAIALYYVLGPKGGIGKTTTARLLIDGLMLSGAYVQVVQIDRAPTLPLLYPDTVTIEVPSADDMRSDPHGAMRVFEPLESLISGCQEKGRRTSIIIDVGAAQNQKAFLDFLARGRLDQHLARLNIKATALVLMTAETGCHGPERLPDRRAPRRSPFGRDRAGAQCARWFVQIRRRIAGLSDLL